MFLGWLSLAHTVRCGQGRKSHVGGTTDAAERGAVSWTNVPVGQAGGHSQPQTTPAALLGAGSQEPPGYGHLVGPPVVTRLTPASAVG